MVESCPKLMRSPVRVTLCDSPCINMCHAAKTNLKDVSVVVDKDLGKESPAAYRGRLPCSHTAPQEGPWPTAPSKPVISLQRA